MEIHYRGAIEAELGRRLEPAELVPVASLDDLSEAEIDVVKALATRQLVVCLNYVRAVVPEATSKEITEYISKISRAG